MRTSLVILILFWTSQSFAQIPTKTVTAVKKFQIGVNYSFDFAYRTLENNNGSQISTAIIEDRNETETFKLGYTAGLNLVYNFSSKLGLQLGAQFSNKGYRTQWIELNPWQAGDPDIPEKWKVVYSYRYIDIPLRANFTFGKKRLRLISSAGIITNLFLSEQSKSYVIYPDRETTNLDQEDQDWIQTNFSPSLSIGLDYQLNESINLRAEPFASYGLLKIVDAPITAYLWNIGLNFGFYYNW